MPSCGPVADWEPSQAGGYLEPPAIQRLRKFFLVFSWSFLCFSLCPLPLVLALGTTGKSLAPSS